MRQGFFGTRTLGPRLMFGHIVPKVGRLQEGLSNTSSKIDLGYHGNLLVTMFNLSKNTRSLKSGDRFCTMYCRLPLNKENCIVVRTPIHPGEILADELEAMDFR